MGFKVVCFNCQKAFNKSIYLNAFSLICPECGGEMVKLSHRFRPPKKEDNKKWEVIKFLIENGFTFQHIHTETGVNVRYPETITEAQEFIIKFKGQAIK